MITLHRKKQSETADAIENRFEELILAYRVEPLPESGRVAWSITDGDTKIQDHKELDTWLEKLEKDLDWQRSISGDGCYIDPETGSVC